MDMCHCPLVQNHRMYATKRELYNVNDELWLIMTCQCRFTSYKSHATLAGDGDDGGGHVCVRAGSIWEISVPSPQVCCEPKKVQSIKK